MVKKEKEMERKKEHVKKLVEGAAMGLGFFVMFGSSISRRVRRRYGRRSWPSC